MSFACVCLAAMSAEIAAIENALTLSFDQERIGIVGRVIDQIGGGAECADFDGLAMLQIGAIERWQRLPSEGCGGLYDSACGAAHGNGRTPRQVMQQPVVVDMGM